MRAGMAEHVSLYISDSSIGKGAGLLTPCSRKSASGKGSQPVRVSAPGFKSQSQRFLRYSYE